MNVVYLPPYEAEVLHYKLAKTNCIHRAIVIINWEEVFHNVDSKKQEMLFNEIALNIIWNFIPHKTLTFDNRDPPSITRGIKKWLTIKMWRLNVLWRKKILWIKIVTYNHVQNIFRLFDDWTKFPFTTSETKRDYQ